MTSQYADASIVLRYQDPNNYYAVVPYYNNITIHEKLGGTYNQRAYGTISPIVPGQVNKLVVTFEGANITIYWNNQYITSWTGATRWSSGKVGFRQCLSRDVRWDNFVAYTRGPGKIVANDDYYPYGMIMEGKSDNQGFSDPRYKYTSKERDLETGYDWFEVRPYDARIGMFRCRDPHAGCVYARSPYAYAGDNPMVYSDPTGMDDSSAIQSNDVGSQPGPVLPTNLTPASLRLPVITPMVGVTGTLFPLNVGVHLEGNVGFAWNLNDFAQSQFVLSHTGAGLVGMGVGVVGGIQAGVGISPNSPSPGTTTEIVNHNESGLGVGKVLGGSLDLLLAPSENGPQISGVAVSKGMGMGGGGYAMYVATGLGATTTIASGNLNQLLDSMIAFISTIRVPQITHGR